MSQQDLEQICYTTDCSNCLVGVVQVLYVCLMEDWEAAALLCSLALFPVNDSHALIVGRRLGWLLTSLE